MSQNAADKALALLRTLPRVNPVNLMTMDLVKKKKKVMRGQHAKRLDKRWHQQLGYESFQKPFFMKMPMEPYYAGHHVRREYPPLSLHELQFSIDQGRIDPTRPIDLTAICNTKYYILNSDRYYGVHLTEDGVDLFKEKVNIEVQWARESVIAAIEKNGGTITTAYYDPICVQAAANVKKFFLSGKAIPRRLLPPQNLIGYYSDPKNRGYLADPDHIAEERFVLSQKYGYVLPDLNSDPHKDMLLTRKDPRQLFYGLEPGWVVNLKDKCIYIPNEEELQEHYQS